LHLIDDGGPICSIAALFPDMHRIHKPGRGTPA